MSKRISACVKSPGHVAYKTCSRCQKKTDTGKYMHPSAPTPPKKKHSYTLIYLLITVSKDRHIFCCFKNELVHPVCKINKCCMFIARRGWLLRSRPFSFSILSVHPAVFSISFLYIFIFGHATQSTHRRRKRNHGREKILCEVLMQNLKDK